MLQRAMDIIDATQKAGTFQEVGTGPHCPLTVLGEQGIELCEIYKLAALHLINRKNLIGGTMGFTIANWGWRQVLSDYYRNETLQLEQSPKCEMCSEKDETIRNLRNELDSALFRIRCLENQTDSEKELLKIQLHNAMFRIRHLESEGVEEKIRERDSDNSSKRARSVESDE